MLYHTRFQPPNADFIGYNLGFPKTGTVALADMFAKANLTAAHEFDRDALLLPVLQKLANDDSGPIRAYMTGERRERMVARFGRPALRAKWTCLRAPLPSARRSPTSSPSSA